MADGQAKSDDLIAELAKLMATAATPEPAPKPAPKLVSVTDAPKPAPVRIPGMDAPAARAAGPTIRIPGMDQPIPITTSAPKPGPTVAPPPLTPQKPAASIDFGTLPAASALKPEPMANWQDREIPRPVPVRPVPVEAPAAPEARAEAKVEAKIEPKPELTMPRAAVEAEVARQAESVVAPDPAAAGTGFEFDFDLDAKPEPAAPRPRSADPIADLIAAELDGTSNSADLGPVVAPKSNVVSVASRVAQPAARPAPSPGTPIPMTPRPAAGVPPRPQATATAAPVAMRPPGARVAGSDRFAVEPDTGAAARTPAVAAPPAPAAPQPDPMDEIESLIGEAVRVELSAVDRPAPQPAPAPIVPPLTTSFAPRRTAPPRDAEPQVQSAEAAILGAAAANVAEPSRVKADERPYKRLKTRPERRGLLGGGARQYIGMAVAGTLLLAAGFGLFWVLGMSRGPADADAPVLTADAAPVKEAPPPQPAATPDGAAVMSAMAGNTDTTDEKLVSRDDTDDTSVADVSRTVGDSDTETTEAGLANRKVRTVTVRPDGTIVSGDEAVAGNEVLPVDRPNVPALPGADVQPSDLLAAVPSGADPIAAAITAKGGSTGTDPAVSALVASAPDATATLAVVDPSVVAPVPMARPVDRTTLGGGANQRVAAIRPAADTPVDLIPKASVGGAPVTVSNAGGAYVQLSSQPSEADAQGSLRTMQRQLGGVLAGRSLAIRQVDLGAKGTWYRVVLPVDSFQEATQTCASFQAGGTKCVAING